MKSIYLPFICMLNIFSTEKTYCQDILDAYIITLKGDSVKGNVQIPGNKLFGRNVFARLGDGVDFREKNLSGHFTYYYPKEIKEFGYYFRNNPMPVRYVSEKPYKKYRLMFIKIDGPLRLYKDTQLEKIELHTIAIDYLYIKKNGAEPLFIADKFYYHPKKRGPLKEYLSDCRVLEEMLNENTFDIDSIVNKYNEWYLKKNQ